MSVRLLRLFPTLVDELNSLLCSHGFHLLIHSSITLSACVYMTSVFLWKPHECCSSFLLHRLLGCGKAKKKKNNPNNPLERHSDVVSLCTFA